MQMWEMQKGGGVSGLRFYFQRNSVLLAASFLSFLLEVQDPSGLRWCSINPTSGLQGSEHLLTEPFLS